MSSTPKSLRSSLSLSKLSLNRFCLRERELNIYASCYGLELLYPYHESEINLSLAQIDPEI